MSLSHNYNSNLKLRPWSKRRERSENGKKKNSKKMTSKDVPVVPVTPATTTTQLPSPVIRITYVDVASVSVPHLVLSKKKKSAPRRTTQIRSHTGMLSRRTTSNRKFV